MTASRGARARLRAQARRKERLTAVTASGSRPSLIDNGLALLAEGDTTGAVTLLQRAVAADKTSSAASDALSGALLECGDAKAASAELARGSVTCAPSFQRHVYLAQLADTPSEGISHLEKALSLDSSGERGARAHCALAEALLAAAEDAEVASAYDARAETAVAAAIAQSGETPAAVEARVALANLRLSQGRVDDARAAMRAAVAPLKAPLRALSGAMELGDAPVDAAADAAQMACDANARLPAVEVRIAIGKQLVECGLFVLAVAVLDSVLWECDFNVEVWFLLALAHLKNGRVAEAREAVDTIADVRLAPDGFAGMLDDRFLQELVREIEVAERHGAAAAPDADRMQDGAV